MEPVRRWQYLRRVMRTNRKLKALAYQLTELHPMRYMYTSDIRDRFKLVITRDERTFPFVDFPGACYLGMHNISYWAVGGGWRRVELLLPVGVEHVAVALWQALVVLVPEEDAVQKEAACGPHMSDKAR